MGRHGVRIDPSFQDCAGISLDNIWRIDIDVETEYKGSMSSLDLPRRGAPRNYLGCAGRGRCGIATSNVTLCRPIRVYGNGFWSVREPL